MQEPPARRKQEEKAGSDHGVDGVRGSVAEGRPASFASICCHSSLAVQALRVVRQGVEGAGAVGTRSALRWFASTGTRRPGAQSIVPYVLRVTASRIRAAPECLSVAPALLFYLDPH